MRKRNMVNSTGATDLSRGIRRLLLIASFVAPFGFQSYSSQVRPPSQIEGGTVLPVGGQIIANVLSVRSDCSGEFGLDSPVQTPICSDYRDCNTNPWLCQESTHETSNSYSTSSQLVASVPVTDMFPQTPGTLGSRRWIPINGSNSGKTSLTMISMVWSCRLIYIQSNLVFST
jgi:hypothetical protein